MVLNGGYRGNEGILESINEKRFSATIVIDSVSIKHRRSSLRRELFICTSESFHEEISLILSYRWDLWCGKMLWSPSACSQPVGKQPRIPHCRLVLCCLPLKRCQDAEFGKFWTWKRLAKYFVWLFWTWL